MHTINVFSYLYCISLFLLYLSFFFFFKQKTAYEMRISDWSSDVCSSDLIVVFVGGSRGHGIVIATEDRRYRPTGLEAGEAMLYDDLGQKVHLKRTGIEIESPFEVKVRSEEHTSELQSLMRISYAVSCLTKKT